MGFNIIQPLDTGCNCRVFLAECLADGKKYALKLPNAINEDQNNIVIVRETEFLKMLDHPNIVKVFYCGTQSSTIDNSSAGQISQFSVLELLANGELHHYLDLTGKFEEELAHHYFLQLVDALHYSHSKGVAHRDIKPSNIMLDEHFNLRLIDFGFAGSSQGVSHEIVGTTEFMAPELNQGVPYVAADVDVFSVGVSLFCMVAGKQPFKQATNQDWAYKFIEATSNEGFWRLHSDYHGLEPSSELRHLIDGMLHADPSKRISLGDVRSHPWCNKPSLPTQTVFTMMQERKRRLINIVKQRRQSQQQMVGAVSVDPSAKSSQNQPTAHQKSLKSPNQSQVQAKKTRVQKARKRSTLPTA